MAWMIKDNHDSFFYLCANYEHYCVLTGSGSVPPTTAHTAKMHFITAVQKHKQFFMYKEKEKSCRRRRTESFEESSSKTLSFMKVHLCNGVCTYPTLFNKLFFEVGGVFFIPVNRSRFSSDGLRHENVIICN